MGLRTSGLKKRLRGAEEASPSGHQKKQSFGAPKKQSFGAPAIEKQPKTTKEEDTEMIFRQFEVERAQTLREMCRVVPYLEEKHVTILVTREWHEIITKGVYPKDAGTETEKFLDSISTADCADFTKKFEEFSRTRVPVTVPVSWKAEIDRLRCWEAEIERLGELLQVALRGEDYKTAAALKSQQLEILGILAQCPTPAAEMSKLLVLENEAAAVKDYERATAIKAALEALFTIAPKEGVDRGPQSSLKFFSNRSFIEVHSILLLFSNIIFHSCWPPQSSARAGRDREAGRGDGAGLGRFGATCGAKTADDGREGTGDQRVVRLGLKPANQCCGSGGK